MKSARNNPTPHVRLLLSFAGMVAFGWTVFVLEFDHVLAHVGFLACTLGFLVGVASAASARMRREMVDR